MRLVFWRGVKSIRKTVEGVRKSRSNFAWKTFEALGVNFGRCLEV